MFYQPTALSKFGSGSQDRVLDSAPETVEIADQLFTSQHLPDVEANPEPAQSLLERLAWGRAALIARQFCTIPIYGSPDPVQEPRTDLYVLETEVQPVRRHGLL